MKIVISEKVRRTWPKLRILIICCEVENSESNSGLWIEIEKESQQFRKTYSIEEINKRPEIDATRKAYKTFGKDPNRYRPSAEALCRRIVREIPIYRVNTLVDIINMVSIRSGFSIGGFDLDKIQGDVELGIGTKMDEFDAIGRGLLNVEGLPLYRDRVGGIGTPTSDNERTKICMETSQLLLIINGYSGEKGLSEAAIHAIELFQKYAKLKKYEITKL
jgi:DNA/RNA-binding domain of Phe-tRNA-synthetase-like protein